MLKKCVSVLLVLLMLIGIFTVVPLTASAEFTCPDCKDVQTLNAEIKAEITKQPTLTEEGVRTYTATVTFDGKSFTDRKTEALPKLYIIGDADGDGELSSDDAAWLKRHLARMKAPKGIGQTAGYPDDLS